MVLIRQRYVAHIAKLAVMIVKAENDIEMHTISHFFFLIGVGWGCGSILIQIPWNNIEDEFMVNIYKYINSNIEYTYMNCERC